MQVAPGSALPRSTEPAAHAQSERSRSAGRGRVLTALVLFAVFVSGGQAFAEPSAPKPLASEAAPSGDNGSTTAKIVLIGAVADDRELGLLFDELLGREGVAVEISRADRFDAAALFAPAEAVVTRVFVVCTDGRMARLHFRG